MAKHLTIAYTTSGREPGYQYVSSTDGFSDATLKTIWQSAMPRGQGWSSYIGGTALKTFPLERGQVALSHVRVTDQEDEGGRKGIRQAEVDVISRGEYLARLESLLKTKPDAVRRSAERKLTLGKWLKVLERALPKMGSRDQVVLAHPYRSPEEWEVIETLILYLATRWSLRAIRGWTSLIPLTTLALAHREESRIIAMPLEKAKGNKVRGYIKIP